MYALLLSNLIVYKVILLTSSFLIGRKSKWNRQKNQKKIFFDILLKWKCTKIFYSSYPSSLSSFFSTSYIPSYSLFSPICNRICNIIPGTLLWRTSCNNNKNWRDIEYWKYGVICYLCWLYNCKPSFEFIFSPIDCMMNICFSIKESVLHAQDWTTLMGAKPFVHRMYENVNYKRIP
jgi:hypothetical protein